MVKGMLIRDYGYSFGNVVENVILKFRKLIELNNAAVKNQLLKNDAMYKNAKKGLEDNIKDITYKCK